MTSTRGAAGIGGNGFASGAGANPPRGEPMTRFEDSAVRASINLERRTDEQLVHDARDQRDPAAREHALYQYLARNGAGAVPVIRRALFEDEDTDLRINLLWALEGVQSEQCRELCLALIDDRDARVQEWARVFAWERGWRGQDYRRPRPFRHLEGRTFDQTIYLHTTCSIFIKPGPANDTWGHLLVSPQMYKRVFGQALACSAVERRGVQEVVATALDGLHADGSTHHEGSFFRGFTQLAKPNQVDFYFESQTRRPVFLSGKANDPSAGVAEDVMVPLTRQGQWFLNPHVAIKGHSAIEYMRGIFQGWAHVNLDRIGNSGEAFFSAGNALFSTLHHPEAGPLTNAFVSGRFSGKVVDWDGDGVLDLNSLPAHATASGEVDTDLDGLPDEPGRHASRHP